MDWTTLAGHAAEYIVAEMPYTTLGAINYGGGVVAAFGMEIPPVFYDPDVESQTMESASDYLEHAGLPIIGCYAHPGLNIVHEWTTWVVLVKSSDSEKVSKLLEEWNRDRD